MTTIQREVSRRNGNFVNHGQASTPPARDESTAPAYDEVARANARQVRLWQSVLVYAGWDDPSDRIIQTALWVIANGRKGRYRAGIETLARVCGKSVPWTEAASAAMHVRQADLGLIGVVRWRKGNRDNGTSEWDASLPIDLLKRLAAMRYDPDESDEQRQAKVSTAVAKVSDRPVAVALMRRLQGQLERQAQRREEAIPKPPLSAVETLRRDLARARARLRERCERDGLEEGQADLIWTAECRASLESPNDEVAETNELDRVKPLELGFDSVSRPDTLSTHMVGSIPPELIALDQWCSWRPPTKVPTDPKSGRNARPDDPRTWSSYSRALARAEADGFPGAVGFVFSGSDPFACVDLDHCRDPETGVLTPEAEAIVRRLDSYTEVSPSGSGVHVVLRGELPPGRRKKKGFECYCTARFLTITGNTLPGSREILEDRSVELALLHAEQFPQPPTPPTGESVSTPNPVGLSDDEVLGLAHWAANGPRFDALMAGDTSAYPSVSEATSALLGLLAFYSQDEQQLDRLIRRSGLMRPKWNERRKQSTWGADRIAEAIRTRTGTYSGRRTP